MGWEAANARARGLATHLLRRDMLSRAAASGSWEAAARFLAGRGYPLREQDLLSRTDLDQAIGRIAAGRLAVLERWLGSHRASLSVVYELEERRSLRRLLRGATQGISPEHRRSGLVPTPGLPERLLHRLSQAPSLEALAAALLRAGHPAGRVLSVRGRQAMTLWQAELALDRLFATRVSRSARGGGRMVREFTALCLDLENAWTLLGAREWGTDVVPRDLFLPGGRAISFDDFIDLAKAPSSDVRWRGVASRFASTPLAAAFREQAAPAALEGNATRALVHWQRAEARRDPLAVSTVLAVALGIRAEAHDVRLVLFACDLGAPASTILSSLETAA
jgi:vacuolar-type H+-ATPase subunit C/Vma6